jgi:DNA-binding response OmpR family regulator
MARDIDRKSAIISGANDYLVKPNDLDKFPKTVKQLLSENSSIQSEMPIGFRSHKGIY